MNRIGDRFLDQFETGGHRGRPEDLDLVAGLGIRTLRYPVLWERTAPERPDERDWRFADERLARIRALGMDPIVGLVHHGSGPRYTSLVDDGFAPGLAAHARAVAERFPWVEAYTPVNEPLTTARFSGLYGHWYPHEQGGPNCARALIGQIRATVLSMAAIHEVNPRARLVQTEDLGKTHATEPLRYQADFENARRWITWDLLCGRVDRDHPMWEDLRRDGVPEAELHWLLDHPCPPDVVGVNHYLTSERFLDHRLDRYPPHTHGSNAYERYADVEAVRVLALGTDGPGALMRETWKRYGLPIAITECHLGCTREEQARWLVSVWRQAQAAQAEGIDVRAVTVWSMFGAHDWRSLLTRQEGHYEPGAFDLRAPAPRPTLIAHTARRLAAGEDVEDLGEGWWERPVRLLYPPAFSLGTPAAVGGPPVERNSRPRPPLLIVGDWDALARAFAARCELRGLDYALLSRDGMDAASPSSIRGALDRYRPWAVIDATRDRPASNDGDGVAAACAESGARLVAFSSDRVFEGLEAGPYVEGDAPRPLPGTGEGQARREREIARSLPEALVVRVGPVFGPWNEGGFLGRAARTLAMGAPFEAVADRRFSPTDAIDLADAALDLLLDGMEGIVHLANAGEISPADLARQVARARGLDERLVVDVPAGPDARSALASERAWVMPTLDDALARYLPQLRLGDPAPSVGFLA